MGTLSLPARVSDSSYFVTVSLRNRRLAFISQALESVWSKDNRAQKCQNVLDESVQAVVHANVRWIVVLSDRHRFGEVLCKVSTRFSAHLPHLCRSTPGPHCQVWHGSCDFLTSTSEGPDSELFYQVCGPSQTQSCDMKTCCIHYKDAWCLWGTELYSCSLHVVRAIFFLSSPQWKKGFEFSYLCSSLIFCGLW